jgi:hypothetical protein
VTEENKAISSSSTKISNQKDLLSEIEKKGEYYLRKRLKQCTASSMLDNTNVKGWPLKKKPNLTVSERITEETVSIFNDDDNDGDDGDNDDDDGDNDDDDGNGDDNDDDDNNDDNDNDDDVYLDTFHLQQES